MEQAVTHQKLLPCTLDEIQRVNAALLPNERMGRRRTGEKRGGKIKLLDMIRELKLKNVSPDLLLQARNVPFDSMAAEQADEQQQEGLRRTAVPRSQRWWKPELRGSSDPHRQLPSERPAPSPWLQLRLRYDSSFISLPHPHAAALPGAPTAAKRPSPSAGPGSSLLHLASSPLAQPPAAAATAAEPSQRCFFASFPAAATFSFSAPSWRGFQKTPSAASPSLVVPKSRKGA
ncbi:uncharacterized protein LOC127461098 [Manacus candei]|uniref:uncharacterized protein LOC127461098 n=1 Tax=Manacus candei TaxID=415023 RepID=UPI00222732E9|nr:uncharacterized protein LOC127461098 [Manacus candei]